LKRAKNPKQEKEENVKEVNKQKTHDNKKEEEDEKSGKRREFKQQSARGRWSR